jgi:hypothetical protein
VGGGGPEAEMRQDLFDNLTLLNESDEYVQYVNNLPQYVLHAEIRKST